MNEQNGLDEGLLECQRGVDEVNKYNPWLETISLISWGFIFTFFTLNFHNLQYILPTIGAANIYFGFRMLRKVNKYFYVAWLMATINLVWHGINLIILATPLNLVLKDSLLLIFVLVIFKIVFLLVFRNGIKMVFIDASLIQKRDPLLWAAISFFLLMLCGIYKINSIIIIIPIVVILLRTIYSVNKFGHELSEVKESYTFDTTTIGYVAFACIYCSICFVLVLISCYGFNQIKLEESVIMEKVNTKVCTELIKMGLPESIMIDITDEDVSKLSNALYVDVKNEFLTFGSNSTVTTYYEGTGVVSKQEGMRKLKNTLKVTTLYIEVPNNELYIIEHFDWMDNKAYWQDGFTIENSLDTELINGILLYDRDGVNYSAPIPRLEQEVITSNNWFNGLYEKKQISGAVNFPFRTNHQRGYVFFKINLPEEQLAGSNILNYLHFSHPVRLPYEESADRISMSGFVNDGIKQHYTNYDTKFSKDMYD